MGKKRKVSPGVTLSQKASPWSLTPQKASPRGKFNQKASPVGTLAVKSATGSAAKQNHFGKILLYILQPDITVTTTKNSETWFLNIKPPTSNLEPPTSNLKPQTSNLEPPTLNLEPPTPSSVFGFFTGLKLFCLHFCNNQKSFSKSFACLKMYAYPAIFLPSSLS